MRPFVKAGKVDDIFRPRVLGNGLFTTTTGYGVSFGLAAIDSENLDRVTLDHTSKQIAIANRCCRRTASSINTSSQPIAARCRRGPLPRKLRRRLSMEARRELTEAVRQRYRSAGRTEKKRFLDEFAEMAG